MQKIITWKKIHTDKKQLGSFQSPHISISVSKYSA